MLRLKLLLATQAFQMPAFCAVVAHRQVAAHFTLCTYVRISTIVHWSPMAVKEHGG